MGVNQVLGGMVNLGQTIGGAANDGLGRKQTQLRPVRHFQATCTAARIEGTKRTFQRKKAPTQPWPRRPRSRLVRPGPGRNLQALKDLRRQVQGDPM